MSTVMFATAEGISWSGSIISQLRFKLQVLVYYSLPRQQRRPAKQIILYQLSAGFNPIRGLPMELSGSQRDVNMAVLPSKMT